MSFTAEFLRGRKAHLENKLRVTEEAAHREGILTAHRHYKLRELIPDIKRALVRLNTGNYGLCTRCENPVPEERLLRHPHVERCVPCQRKHEQQRGHP